MGAGARGRDRRGDRAGRRSRCRSAPRAPSTSPSSATSPTCATFVDGGGQKGVQRPVLPAGHAGADPPGRVPGASPRGRSTACRCRPSSPAHAGERRCSRRSRSGSRPSSCRSCVIAPAGRQRHGRHRHRARGRAAAVGRHREPARRLRRHRRDGGSAAARRPTPRSSRCCSAARTTLHNNYQDFQAFLDTGGKIGLQHDPLLYGAYLLNPFLVRVEMVPMLVVNQGEVAVDQGASSACRRSTRRATEFKFGSIVRPGHRGIWQEPLRTGKYPINPRVLRGRDRADVDPHAQLGRRDVARRTTSTRTCRRSSARAARASCSSIDLQVQIHVPDTQGAEGDLDGRHDAEPRQRGAAGGGRQPLPQHAAGARGGASSSRPATQVQAGRVRGHHRVPAPLRGRDARRLHPGRRASRRSSSRC